MWLISRVKKYWTIIVQTVLVISAMVLPFTKLQYNSTIIGLLLIIAGEYFWNSIVYFEKFSREIKVMSQNICGTSVILQTDRTGFPIEDEITRATNSIFLSGSTLYTMFQCRDVFSKIPSNIRLEIVYTDFSKPELLSAFRSMIGYDLNEESLRKQFELGQKFCDYVLRKRPSTRIRKVDYIMPIVYVGIDWYEAEETTVIRAKHYLNNTNADEERFIIVSKCGTEYFNIYKRQMKSILNASNEHRL